MKHVKTFYFNEARDLAKEVQIDHLLEWIGPVRTTHEMCYKWP